MENLYFVIRMTKRQDGTIVAPAENRTTEQDARSLFYTRAGQAVASDNLIDTVVLLAADGFLMDKASFTHDPIAAQ